MAEDAVKEAGLNTSEVTHQAKPPKPIDLEAARKSIESAIRKGAWPKREELSSPEIQREWPTKEEQQRVLSQIPGKETVPTEIKRELTEEAKRLNTMAIGSGGESDTEIKELPHVPPFVESPPPKPIDTNAARKSI